MEFLSIFKRVPTSQSKFLILVCRDKICINMCKHRGNVVDFFYSLVLIFVITLSKNV